MEWLNRMCGKGCSSNQLYDSSILPTIAYGAKHFFFFLIWKLLFHLGGRKTTYFARYSTPQTSTRAFFDTGGSLGLGYVKLDTSKCYYRTGKIDTTINSIFKQILPSAQTLKTAAKTLRSVHSSLTSAELESQLVTMAAPFNVSQQQLPPGYSYLYPFLIVDLSKTKVPFNVQQLPPGCAYVYPFLIVDLSKLQGSKLATYMNRGGPGGPNFAGPNPGGPSGSSNAAQMSQMVSDLNNLGLDQNTLKQLSMKGIREFMPTTGSSGSGLRGSPHDNSGSSSPFPQNYGSTGGSQQRLQPPAASMSSYGSPRASPTPSSGSVSSMMTAQQTQDMNNAAAAQGGDPASISTYSDGGTTYFYAGDEMVRF